MEQLEKPIWNIAGIILLSIISSAILWSSNLDGVGMGWIIVMWIPVILGIVAIVLYLLSRLLFKKKNWIISVVVMAISLILSIQFYFSN